MAENLKTALRPIHKAALAVVAIVAFVSIVFPAQVGNVFSLVALAAAFIAFLYLAVTVGTLISQHLAIQANEQAITSTIDKLNVTIRSADRTLLEEQLADLRAEQQRLLIAFEIDDLRDFISDLFG